MKSTGFGTSSTIFSTPRTNFCTCTWLGSSSFKPDTLRDRDGWYGSGPWTHLYWNLVIWNWNTKTSVKNSVLQVQRINIEKPLSRSRKKYLQSKESWRTMPRISEILPSLVVLYLSYLVQLMFLLQSISTSLFFCNSPSFTFNLNKREFFMKTNTEKIYMTK